MHGVPEKLACGRLLEKFTLPDGGPAEESASVTVAVQVVD